MQYRLSALGAAVAMAVCFGLYQIVFEQGVDLVPRTVAGFATGELLALIVTLPIGLRQVPLTTLLYVAMTVAWLYVLFHYLVPVLPVL